MQVPGMSNEMTTDELVRDLYVRFTRVEKAILGDPTIGHVGLVNRVEVLERHDGNLDDRIKQVESQSHARLDSIEKKLDRAIWLSLGAFIGGGAIGGGSVWAILGG